MLVHLHHANRTVGAREVAAERKACDVHPMSAKKRTHFTDHTGLIVVLDDEQCSVERRFNADAIDQHEAEAPVGEYRAFNPPISFVSRVFRVPGTRSVAAM